MSINTSESFSFQLMWEPFFWVVFKMAADAYKAKNRISVKIVVETCMIAQMKGIDTQITIQMVFKLYNAFLMLETRVSIIKSPEIDPIYVIEIHRTKIFM